MNKNHLILSLLLAVSLLSGCGWMTRLTLPYLDEHRRLEVEGEDAEAKILSATQTGLYLNDQPELKLSLWITRRDGAAFPAETNLICPLIFIPVYQPGNVVPVKIDPVTRTATISGSYERTPGIN